MYHAQAHVLHETRGCLLHISCITPKSRAHTHLVLLLCSLDLLLQLLHCLGQLVAALLSTASRGASLHVIRCQQCIG